MTEMVPAWLNGTLSPVEKLEVHQRGLRHLAVSVFVMDGDKTLIQRRALSKYHTPGLWANTCCTHPRWREDAATCAARRLREELGITGLTLRRVGEIEYRADVGAGLIEHEVVEVFAAETRKTLRLAPNPDEVMQTAWIPLGELHGQVRSDPARFTPWLGIYLEKGFGALSRELSMTESNASLSRTTDLVSLACEKVFWGEKTRDAEGRLTRHSMRQSHTLAWIKPMSNCQSCRPISVETTEGTGLHANPLNP